MDGRDLKRERSQKCKMKWAGERRVVGSIRMDGCDLIAPKKGRDQNYDVLNLRLHVDHWINGRSMVEI